MTDTIFIIGDKRYPAPPLNFKALRTVWPYVQGVQDSNDMDASLEALPIIVSAALARSDNPLTIDEIEENLLASEIQGLQESVTDLFVSSSLLTRSGDAPGDAPGEAKGEAAPPSMATGTDSLQNLLPPVVQAPTGIE